MVPQKRLIPQKVLYSEKFFILLKCSSHSEKMFQSGFFYGIAVKTPIWKPRVYIFSRCFVSFVQIMKKIS